MSGRSRFAIKRVIAWGVPVVGVVALLVLSLRPQSIPVDLAVAEIRSVRVTVDEEGKTRVRERFTVAAPVAGVLLRIALEPGDLVQANETVLATFRPSSPVLLDARGRAEAEARVRVAAAQVAQATAERRRAEAERDHAQKELKRLGRLVAAEVLAQDRFDEAATTASSREQSVKAAQFAEQAAEYELVRSRAVLTAGQDHSDGQPIEIRSPVNGVVLQRFHESETVVVAGEPLVEVGDAAAIEVVADLLSSAAVRVRGGQQVVVEQWGGDAPLHGLVRRVEPFGYTKVSALGVEEQRVDVVIDPDDDPTWRALGDGYRVEVRIVVAEAKDVLAVPASSLFRHGDGWAVWAIEDDRAARRVLDLGLRNALHAEVLGGLDAGDRVVQFPSEAVVESVRIAARE